MKMESVCESKCAFESFWSCISASWRSSSRSESIGSSGSSGISSAASAESRMRGSSFSNDSSSSRRSEDAMLNLILVDIVLDASLLW